MLNPKQVIKAWVLAFNARDAEAAASLYHEDAENIQIALGVPLKGRAAILEDLQKFFLHTPDSVTRIENLFQEGDWVMLEWSGGGTFYPAADKGDLTNGKPYKLQGCGFFHVLDGKIRFQRGYWDKATWFEQVGIPVD